MMLHQTTPLQTKIKHFKYMHSMIQPQQYYIC